MSFKQGYKARILNGDFSLSAKLTSISVPIAIEMHDVTTFADNGVKRSLPGLDTSTLSCDGITDATTVADSVAWTTAQPFTYAHDGLTAGSPVTMVNALESQFSVSTAVADVARFQIAGQTDGPSDFGVVLHDETAETADTAGSAVDGGAASTNGGVAHLHVTGYSGLTNAVIVIDDSATGSSGWATIGTFTTVTAATSQRLAIAGTIRRYTRWSIDVTGTGSVTFAVTLARH